MSVLLMETIDPKWNKVIEKIVDVDRMYFNDIKNETLKTNETNEYL